MSHVALLAPPWIPIPPPAYGGIEQVVRLLAAGLVDAGHRVTLFAAAGVCARRRRCARRCRSRTRTRSSSPCGRSTTSRGASTRSTPPRPTATRSTSCTITRGSRRWPWPTGLQTPLVHTLHGPFEPDLFRFYAVPWRQGAARRDQRAPSATPRPSTCARDRGGATTHSPSRNGRSRGRGRVSAVDRAHERRQGAAAGDRRGARGGHAAGPRRPGPPGPGGVLRPRGRAAHRRRRGALRRRGRRGRQARAVHAMPERC